MTILDPIYAVVTMHSMTPGYENISWLEDDESLKLIKIFYTYPDGYQITRDLLTIYKEELCEDKIRFKMPITIDNSPAIGVGTVENVLKYIESVVILKKGEGKMNHDRFV